ncbi:MAG TPA: DUF4912 domain-containing protein [Bryobacteraceae bacterium]|jgi:hypothetical protein
MTAEEAKFYPPGSPDPVSLEPGELPSSYGSHRLVLLPVDPHRIYAYWVLSADPLPTAGSRAVLRVHESSASGEITRPFDVDVDLAAGNAYIHLWSAEKTYSAEIGLRGEDGAFVSLAHSNSVTSPPAAPVPAVAPPPRSEPKPSAAAPAPPLPPPSGPAAAAATASALNGPTTQTRALATPQVPAVASSLPRTAEVPERLLAQLVEVFNRNAEFSLSVAPAIEPPPEPDLAVETDSGTELIAATEPDPESQFEERTIFGDLPFQPAYPVDLTQYCQDRFLPGVSSEAGRLAD